MNTADEGERFWRELQALRDRQREAEAQGERHELSIAGLYDAVLQLHEHQRAGFEKLSQTDREIADRAADAIAAAVRRRLDQRSIIVAATASSALQLLSYLISLSR
jgi:hypothetical protein